MILQRIQNALWRRLGRYYMGVLAQFSGIRVQAGVVLVGAPFVQNQGTLQLGRRATLVSAPNGNPLWCNRPCIFITAEQGKIVIGDNFSASGCCIIAKESVQIGNNVRLGANVTIIDNDMHDPYSPLQRGGMAESPHGPVAIEDNVWIGANATVLKGVRIGKNSVIGTGVVVRTDVEADCVLVPASNVQKKIQLRQSGNQSPNP